MQPAHCRSTQSAEAQSLCGRLRLGLAAWLLLAITLTLGCSGIELSPKLPEGNLRVEQQLYLHSDFSLEPDHRLLSEVIGRKGDLEEALGFSLGNERIHVYLFDDQQEFQRYARRHLPALADRRAIFLKSDTRLMVLAHWHDDLGVDLRHEITHGYLHAELPWIPLWLDEGLAEYFEVPGKGPFVHPEHIAHLASAFRSGIWQPHLERLASFNDPATFTATQYAESWLWVHFFLNSTPERAELFRAFTRELQQHPEVRASLPAELAQQGSELQIEVVEHLRGLAEAAAEPRQLSSATR